MKAYIDTETGTYPVYEEDIKNLFPHTSFEIPFVAPANYVEVQPIAPPFIAPNQKLVEGQPALSDGIYLQTWGVEEIDDEAFNQRKARILAQLRNQRDKKLKATDWIASTIDVPLAPEVLQQWLDYRQALRDMFNEADPFQIKFPEEPRPRLFRSE